jgi:hypothetical protein
MDIFVLVVNDGLDIAHRKPGHENSGTDNR